MSKAPKEAVFFKRPTIGRRLYIAEGPSGWPEQFSRAKLDEELTRLLGSITVEAAVDLFITQRELSEDKKPETWHTVIGFLGRILEMHPFAIPHEAALAFWAQVILTHNSREAN